MPIVHLVTIQFYPTHGGLQESLVRIAQLINNMPGWTTRVYVRDEHNRCDEEGGIPGLNVIAVGQKRQRLMEPVSPLSADRFRTDCLIIRTEIERKMQEDPKEKHLLLSFGLPQNGFIAQQVASALGLPHLSCFRGTDFSRDCFDPYAQTAITYVIQRAVAVITTNEEQKRFLRSTFGPKTNILRIYNGVEAPQTRWSHRANTDSIKLAADCGYAFKKGTHLLLSACDQLIREGVTLELSLCGATAPFEEEYWTGIRNDYEARLGPVMRFRDVIAKEEVAETLLNSDLYCSATLGEGCSLARSKALLMGMPIVSTRCGELADLAPATRHIFLAPPSDPEGFVNVLRSACEQVMSRTIQVDHGCVQRARSELSVDVERETWRKLLSTTVTNSVNASADKQFRVVMYAHDGRGLGHVRRLCRLAKALQGECAVLLLSGLRESSWLVPPECEFIHLPNLDSIDPWWSRQWGREPFWKAGRAEGLRLRRAVIQSVVDAFAPDAIVIDFLPAGKNDEMFDVLDRSSARRYLVFRGVLDNLSGVEFDILNETGRYLLEKRYDRILVTADRKIVDVISEYRLNATIANKIKYTGYIANKVTNGIRQRTRLDRGVPSDARWVVCSAGGGRQGEDLIAYCQTVSDQFPEVYFDIVLGPRSTLALGTTDTSSPRVRVSQERRDLPQMHASCDVLICRGGYNSLMEAATGHPRVLVVPINGDHEQLIHADRLAPFFPIRLVDGMEKLAFYLKEELTAGPRLEPGAALNFDGAESTASAILEDLRRMER